MNTFFNDMLEVGWQEGHFICVGLDSDFKKLPKCLTKKFELEDAIFQFNKAIVDATHDIALAYKPNIAFYNGEEGRRALQRTFAYIRVRYAHRPTILDFKRADIGNTNEGYVAEGFTEFRADAVTVNPYFGAEALEPFLKLKDCGIIVLCRTSNPGAGEFQDQKVLISDKELAEFFPGMSPNELLSFPGWKQIDLANTLIPLYQKVALHVTRRWNKNNTCALVVGATAPEELGIVRQFVGDMPILVPGVGAQGGDLEAVLRYGMTSQGKGLIVNSSRDIIFRFKEEEKTRGADYKGEDFAELARKRVLELNQQINAFRQGR